MPKGVYSETLWVNSDGEGPVNSKDNVTGPTILLYLMLKNLVALARPFADNRQT
jgi:hypothetical protein